MGRNFSMVIVFIALIFVVWQIISLIRSHLRRVKQPSCGRCKYPVSGLSSFTCPECGQDLRTVGIITPAMRYRRRVYLWQLVIAWTAASAGACMLMLGILSTFSLLQRSTFIRSTHYLPISQTFGRLDLLVEGKRDYGRTTTESVTLTVSGIGGNGKGSSSLYASDGEWSAGAASGTGLPDGAAIAKWLNANGVNGSATQAEADELAVVVARSAAGDLNTLPASKSVWSSAAINFTSNSTGPSPLLFVAGGVLWLSVWGTGMWLLVRKWRAKRERSEHAIPALA